MSRQRVLLAASELAASTPGELLSREARRLLSQLAAEQGLDCPELDWSPGGDGPPRHPALPLNWFAGITHKRGWVIVGLSDGAFGIDLEHFNPRHASRIIGLTELLPEAWVREAILQADCPQQAFYRAWTLHEALFKQASQTDQPATSVLATRLSPALAAQDQTMLWQSPQWTLAITGCGALTLETDPAAILPEMALCGMNNAALLTQLA